VLPAFAVTRLAVLALSSALAFAALFLAPAARAPLDTSTLRAYVTAEDDDAVVAVDLSSGRVLRRIPVADGPHNIAADPDGFRVVVTSPPAGRVTLLSGRALRVEHVFGGFGSPHDVELSPDGRYAYVTDESRGQIGVLDLVSRRVTARIRVGPRPHDLAVGDLVWVTHRGSNLTALDLRRPAHPRVTGHVAAGGPAHDISRAPDTANVYVTYWNSGTWGGIDAGTGRLLFRRRAGDLIHHVQFDYFAGNRAWLTDHADGRVLLASARTGRVLRTVAGCPGAHHVALARGRVAVACHDSGRLLVLDRSARKVRSIRVGRGLHGVAIAQTAPASGGQRASAERPQWHGDPIEWRTSRSLGKPWAGLLVNGVQLPAEGAQFFTWDPVLKTSPNRPWRRWGSHRLLRTIFAALEAYFAANPDAPRVAIGDLSRPQGGIFDERFGGRGHASHQNGRDVDVYYPRLDGEERAAERPREIDRRLAQELVTRFVQAGAVKAFVGPRTGLTGPKRIVERLIHHDNHVHIRISPDRPVRAAGGRSAAGGRPLEAVYVGDPAARPRVLVVGCIHGTECAGIRVTRRLARAQPEVGLWLVHNLNPDGFALDRRQNGRGVDLNRNFDSDWRLLGRPWDPEYPGPRPFSEPETRFVQRLILRLRPDVTIWFHQPQAIIRAWGRSVPAARRYARLAGMRFRAIRWPAGTAPNWQNQRLHMVSFVVELPAGPLSSASASRHARAVLALMR
jgi:protein MpaA